MSREKELLDLVTNIDAKNKIKAIQLVKEIIFVEENLIELKKYPFISVNPNNPTQQKSTPAAKQYKEFLQQYNNSLKLLFRLAGDTMENDEESPLRKWVKSKEV